MMQAAPATATRNRRGDRAIAAGAQATKPSDPALAPTERARMDEFLHDFLASKASVLADTDLATRFSAFVMRGKLMRALLVTIGYRLGTPGSVDKRLPEDVIRVAVALELLHSSLLIHDDIIDRSETRRGDPSWHTHYAASVDRARRGVGSPMLGADHVGLSMAICAGNVGFFFSFEILATLDTSPEIARRLHTVVAQTVGAAGLGELRELRLTVDGQGTAADAAHVNLDKTALYSCTLPLLVGGLLGGAEDGVLDDLHAMGADMGHLFQLVDDELDLFGEEGALGKPTGTDVREGRHTLLYTMLREGVPAKEWRRLAPIYGRIDLSANDLQLLRDAAIQHGVRDAYHAQIASIVTRTLGRIDALPCSPPSRSELIGFVHAVAHRHK
jgi:geranylgeranyl pyrophosphate synthase